MSDNTDDLAADDGFDEFARSAGAALRREAPSDGLDRVRSARRRQRTTRAVIAGGATLTIIASGSFVISRAGTDDGAVANDSTAQSTTAPTTGATGTSSRSSTSAPTSTSLAANLPLSSDTPLVWGDGVLLGAFVDDKFVAAAETSGLPPDLLGSDLQLLDRTMGTATWTLELDQCNAGALRSRDSGALFLRGWLWSADYPFTGTLEGGQVESGDADLVAALVELGIDPDTVERSTPPQSLDPDPELETVVRRLAPDIDTNGYEFAWLAVWDPTTSALITFAGDPVSNEVRFTLNGEGPTDVEGRGYLSDTITTDTNITLRELATGRTLSSVDVCNP